MKKNFKKTLSLILEVLMVMTIVPFSGLATDGEWDCSVNGHEFYGDLVLRTGKHARWCDHCDTFGYTVYNEEEDKTEQIEGLMDCRGEDATCSERSYCYGCDRYFGDYDYDNHDFSKRDKQYLANPATCQEAATYYYTCEYCGQCEWNSEHTYKVGTADVVNGHRGYEDDITPNNDGTHHIDLCYLCLGEDLNATCTGGYANCSEKAVCEYCEEEYGDFEADTHDNIRWKAPEEATCQKEGHDGYNYCADCNTPVGEYTSFGRLNHVYSDFVKDADADTHTKTCTTCDPEVGEVAKITEPCTGGTANCTDKAVCTVCEAAYGDVKHVWDNGTVEDATCTADGTRVFKCTVDGCNAEKEEAAPGTALNHDFTEQIKDDAHLAQPGNCTTPAKYYYDCSRCDFNAKNLPEDAEKPTFDGDTTEHNFVDGDTSRKPATEATCSKAATYYKRCDVCNKYADELNFKSEEYTFASGEPHAKPTKGYLDGNGDVVKAPADKEADYLTDPAKCLENERYTYLCKECGERMIPKGQIASGKEGLHFYEKPNTALNPYHDTSINMELIDKAVEATCTDKGKAAKYRCKAEGCNVEVGGGEIPAKGHKWDKEQAYVDPTCGKSGSYGSKHCGNCNSTFYYEKDGKEVTITATFNPSIKALTHEDANDDLICDRCFAEITAADVCKCVCHSTGFMYFIALILKFFWKLTGSSPYCECEVPHY